MDKLKSFFDNNDVRIGTDFTSSRPIYYSSLYTAFENYFATFRDKKDSLHFIFHSKNADRKNLGFNYSGTDSNVVSAILGFHRFIELLLKDILRRINPYLAVKFIEDEQQLFQHLDSKSGVDADKMKTVEYGETIKRIKRAFSYYDSNTAQYNEHLKEYAFIIEPHNQESLRALTFWRNRIMHNGSTMPNMIALDYLITQRVIPLIYQILNAEKKVLNIDRPFYLSTPTGIDLLEKISSKTEMHERLKG